MVRLTVCLVALVFLAGCGDLTQSSNQPADRGIIGKTTQDVGEYRADANREVSDGKIGEIDPALGPLAPLKAYGPVLEQVTTLAVQQNLQLYHAEHGRYPKDHAEFMEVIIKAYNMQLPVLPAGNQYQYDVENHQLIIVKPEGEKEEATAEGQGGE
ncbi:MAG: hypothetical protein AB7O62_17765 [Pirellulales bacterium]